MAEPTFLVDKKGLAKVLATKPKAFIVGELLQNAWDEDGVTEVTIHFNQENGKAYLSVLDDAPEGFSDLSHAYTLFAESKKKGDAEKRGRFNLGEKLVIAISDRVQISTTKGTIVFDEAGRTMLTGRPDRTSRGSMVTCELRMNKDEAEELRTLVYSMIPPRNITTIFNGSKLTPPTPEGQWTETLPTVIADAEGFLKPTARRTSITIYSVADGDKAMLYEMGIPVVETGDGFHVNIHQKVPLNSDRDNVTPSYLQKVRTTVLNHVADLIKPEDTAKPWVNAALEDKAADQEAVKTIVTARFGDKVVISDPSDPEANKIAVSKGYVVLAPRTFTHDGWNNVRQFVKPAGQVTPSDKPYSENGVPVTIIPEADWTGDMHEVVSYMQVIGRLVLDREVPVRIINNSGANFIATYGRGAELTLNYGKLGKAWFARKDWMDYAPLALHEFAHEFVTDHLSHDFADTIARLGAKLAKRMELR